MDINTEKRDAMMAYITATATASNEDDVNALLKIFNPGSDRKETGKNFEEAIGYDPITYFDIKDVTAIIDKVMDHVSTDGVRILVDHKDAIIDKTMEIFDERRDKHLRNALATALVDFLNADDLESASMALIGNRGVVATLTDDEDGESDEDEPLMDDDDFEDEDNDDDVIRRILNDSDDILEIPDEEDDD